MLIESLSSGGAERQVCVLASELKRRGHDVQVVTYAPGNFYVPFLESSGVKYSFLGGKGTIEWVLRIRRFLRKNKQDVVLAFLGSSASYAELAALPLCRWGLVVSERFAEQRLSKGINRLKKMFHLVADVVTTNSHTNRIMLEVEVPWLKPRIVTIYNAVDLETFKPGNPVFDADKVRLVVAARINEQKNVLRTIEAIDLLRKQCINATVSVDWFGNTADDAMLWRSCMDLIKKRKLEDYFRFHEPIQDIIAQYQQADAVLLPSLYEGLPNTVCEGMACGKPILMSSVCDAGNLVKDNGNGFLFSPDDPSQIAEAIAKFASLNAQERSKMGERSRAMAESYFGIREFADKYESVLYSAIRSERPDCGHWLPEVPQTALDYFERARTR